MTILSQMVMDDCSPVSGINLINPNIDIDYSAE